MIQEVRLMGAILEAAYHSVLQGIVDSSSCSRTKQTWLGR